MATLKIPVDFLIIGAGKSGTTSLYYYLAQHPCIFMPRIKEPQFFLLPGLDIDTTADQREWCAKTFPGAIAKYAEYSQLFVSSRPGQLCGEASVRYLQFESAARNLGTYAPDVKLICVLRNPVERAFSNFAHAKRDRADDRGSVLAAFRQDGIEHPYFSGGFYDQQLQRYADLAPNNPLRVWLYDELVRDSGAVVREIFEYLGVDSTFTPDISFRANVSGEANRANLWARVYDWAVRSRWRRNPMVRWMLTTTVKQMLVRVLAERANVGRVKPELTALEWETLGGIYSEEITRLEKRLGRNLSHWRKRITDRPP